MNIIKINKDKTLEKTSFRAIYQNESRADEIDFLIDPSIFIGDVEDYKIMLQAVIPVEDKEHQTPTINKMRYMEIEEEPYKNRYLMRLPITSALTEGAGEVLLWFLFFDMSDAQKIRLLKTNTVKIDIKKTNNDSSIELEDKEFDNVLSKLQKEIEDIKLNKMDKKFDYDEQTNTIQFYNNGEPIGEPIKMDNEVIWKGWD